MANHMIQCPLCDGESEISRARLTQGLNDPAFRTKLETLLAEFDSAIPAHSVAVAAAAGDFQTQVHSWNPANPMWKRSPKE